MEAWQLALLAWEGLRLLGILIGAVDSPKPVHWTPEPVPVCFFQESNNPLQNTPQQDYVWAMWDYCKASGRFNASVAYIDRVEASGRAWSNASIGPAEIERPLLWACMHEQYKLHPYKEWLKAGGRWSE